MKTMSAAMRRSARVLLGIVGAAVLLGACQQAPPVAEVKKKRRSFEDSYASRPSTAPASSGSASSTDAQAQQVQQTWEQARQATTDAERQRLANEALNKTQEMAEPQPSGQ